MPVHGLPAALLWLKYVAFFPGARRKQLEGVQAMTKGAGRKRTRGSGDAPRVRHGGRRKTLKDLGVERVPSARELFARHLRAQLPVYAKRRVPRKEAFWCLPTLHAKFRALPAMEMAAWVERAEKLKEERRVIVKARGEKGHGGECDGSATAAIMAHGQAGHGATTTWLRLDCCAESPGHASEVAEVAVEASVPVDRLRWMDDPGGDLRTMRRLPDSVGSLGSGCYGACYIFEDEDTGEQVCAKLQKTAEDDDGEQALRRELRIMNACNHPNVMRGFSVVRSLGSGRHALLMTKCDCDLWAWLSMAAASAGAEHADARTQQRRSAILLQACRGYAHLHGAGFLHLDIKPENVVVQAATGMQVLRVRIADFGISRTWSPSGSGDTTFAPASRIQSESYRPWDCFHAAKGRVPLRPRLDVWAFGCLVFDVCCEHPRQRGDGACRPRLFAGIHMGASYESVMASRNYRLGGQLRARDAALVVRCQDLKDPHRNHVRMGELLPACRALAGS